MPGGTSHLFHGTRGDRSLEARTNPSVARELVLEELEHSQRSLEIAFRYASLCADENVERWLKTCLDAVVQAKINIQE